MGRQLQAGAIQPVPACGVLFSNAGAVPLRGCQTMTSRPDPASPLPYHFGILLVLLAGACWSTVGIGIRLIEDATAWQILFYRSLSLALFLCVLLFVRSRGRPFGVFAKAGLPAVMGGIALTAAFVGSVVAIIGTTVANAMFLFASAPFFVAVLSWLILRERVRRATWIAIAFAIFGIGLMVVEAISGGQLLGNAAAVLSALGFAFFTLALRWGRTNDMAPVIFYGAIFTTILTGAVCLLNGDGLVLSNRDAGIATALGVVALGGGMSIYTIGSRVVPAAELALLAMTEVLLGPFWVWLFLGETAGLYTLAGGAILMSAIVVNALSGLRHRPVAAGVH